MNIEQLKLALQNEINKGNEKNVTSIRGRLIEVYKREINKLLKKENLTDDEKEKLNLLKNGLTSEVEKHKIQLSSRYKNEFIDKKTKWASILTVLPNAVSIAVNKTKTCIEDLKNAKDNKERMKKRLEVMKSVGLLASTPIVYLGKFALDQWYAVLGLGAVWYFKNNPLKLAELVYKVNQNYDIPGIKNIKL